jgi:hypothetical protein
MRDEDFCVVALVSSGLCALFGLLIGSPKNRGAEGFLWGFLLGPIGLLVIAVQGKVYKRRCPYCRAGIPESASRCRHCAADLGSRSTASERPIMAIPVGSSAPPVSFHCVGCKRELRAPAGQTVSCPYCQVVMQSPFQSI